MLSGQTPKPLHSDLVRELRVDLLAHTDVVVTGRNQLSGPSQCNSGLISSTAGTRSCTHTLRLLVFNRLCSYTQAVSTQQGAFLSLKLAWCISKAEYPVILQNL